MPMRRNAVIRALGRNAVCRPGSADRHALGAGAEEHCCYLALHWIGARLMSSEAKALRSFLFAPGNHARRVEKALTLDADAVILDLEDAVAIAEKPAAREAVAAAFARPRRGLLYVRVNAVDSEFCYGDLVAIVRPGLDGIILPKVESAAGLATIDWLLRQLERERGLPPGGIDLIPIIETGAGLDRPRRHLA